jgi:Protein of unknown function (DUF2510)
MAEVEGQTSSAELAAKWRGPLETTALILLTAVLVSVVGGIVSGVFTPDASGWDKLRFLAFNVVSIWHVAVLLVAVGLVFALRLPFAPDARGAGTARLALLDALLLGATIAICALLGAIGSIGESDEFGLTVPEKIGEIMQFLGGGAVAVAAVLLAVRGQSLFPARVRPAPAPAAAPTMTPAAAPGSPGWASDPYGRHQWRYWDGTRWTDQVADGSTQSTDPAA